MYKLNTLSNGLRLITVPMRGTQTATILVMVGTGSKYETRENSGISHFLEHMFFKGTTKRPNSLAISSELDGLGAEYNAFTGKEYTGYWVKTSAAKIAVGMDIVSDMLQNSRLETAEINRERGVILEEMNMYRDNPMMYIEDIFEECLYGDTPAGWDTIGTKETVTSVKRKDFVDYLNNQYATHNTFVLLAGNIPNNIKINNFAAVQKYFSAPKYSQRGINFQEKEAVTEAQAKPAVKLHYKKTDQAHLSLGVRTFGYAHKDRRLATLLAVILGGSMSSRLFINLRERKGLAYYVRTNAEYYTDSGYLTTRAGVPTAKLDEAIKIIKQEYRRLKNTLVPKEELQRAKDMLRGRLTIQLESSDNQANWYARQAVMLDTISRTEGKEAGLKRIQAPDAYFKRIEKITTHDLKRAANDIFKNQGLNLAVIGPYKQRDKTKELLKL